MFEDAEISVQQAAKNVCAEHGVEAENFASAKMQDLIERDDAKGASYWMAVLHEIKRMPTSHVH